MHPLCRLKLLPPLILAAFLAPISPGVVRGQVAAPLDRPCAAMEITQGIGVDGFVSDKYLWSDGACHPRSAALVRNDVQDPTGHWGGYLRQYVYDADGTTRVVNGSGDRYPGFGLLVNHFADTYYASHSAPGAGRSIVFAGRHHAIHEFKSRLNLGGGPVDATVHWFFATGRDHPVWAVTFDSSPAGPNAVQADTRAPRTAS